MIFATAGTQLPFDRFVEALDRIAPDLSEPLMVQALPGKYVPRNFDLRPMLSRDEFDSCLRGCSLMVAHAGIGSVVEALRMSKPVVVFPRRGALGEHRNDHQMATARRFGNLGYAYVACEVDALRSLLCGEPLHPLQAIGSSASDELCRFVRSFIKNN